jgi:GNAT superfamily N-acetyltransferase
MGTRAPIGQVSPLADETVLAGLVETLCDAFADDAHINWIVRQDARRDAARRQFFRLLLTDLAGQRGRVFATGDLKACAIWFPAEGWQLDLATQARVARRFIEISGWQAAARKAYGLNRVEASRPRTHHFFLQTLGVRAGMQGKGYGAALLQRFCQDCETANAAGYLETGNPGNIPFYEKHGFRVVGRVALPRGPTLFQMLRAG